MKTYELTYIISSEITSEEAGAKAKDINSSIESEEGVILRSDSPIAKTLSYPIKKMGSGYFTVLEFQIEPEKLSGFEEKIKKDEKILRHLVTIKNPARLRKERRSARKPLAPVEPASIADDKIATDEKDKKVELKEIEKKLDELLSE